LAREGKEKREKKQSRKRKMSNERQKDKEFNPKNFRIKSQRWFEAREIQIKYLNLIKKIIEHSIKWI
jgi:hypothetical protein